MQVISLCADLKSERYSVLGQSCVKTGGLRLFVVMFLPVANVRTGADEQNVAWLPMLLNMGLVLFNFQQKKTNNNKKTPNKRKPVTETEMKVIITGKK